MEGVQEPPVGYGASLSTNPDHLPDPQIKVWKAGIWMFPFHDTSVWVGVQVRP